MNLFEWLKENQSKYLDMINRGEFVFPCFEQTCYDTELCTEIETTAMDIVQKDEMDIIQMIPIITQYLYETYHLAPYDVEAFCMLLNYRSVAELERAITESVKKCSDTLIEKIEGILDNNNEEEDDND